MAYELYYWPGIQGRGEFVRLALEEVGAPYVDVAREHGEGRGVAAMTKIMRGKCGALVPFAPPFLKGRRRRRLARRQHPRLSRAQSSASRRAPRRCASSPTACSSRSPTSSPRSTTPIIRFRANSITRTRRSRPRRALPAFLDDRLPKFLGYFERVARGKSRRPDAQRRRLADHGRSLAVPARRRARLRLSARDGEIPASAIPRWRRCREAVRARPAIARLSRFAAPPALQRIRHLPPLSRARPRRQVSASPEAGNEPPGARAIGGVFGRRSARSAAPPRRGCARSAAGRAAP